MKKGSRAFPCHTLIFHESLLHAPPAHPTPPHIQCLIRHTLVARPRAGPRNTHRSLGSVGERKTLEVMTRGEGWSLRMSTGVPWYPSHSGPFDSLPHTWRDGGSSLSACLG